MKLIKLHLTGHSPLLIWLYGTKPKNMDGSGPESNLQVKVKNKAKMTRMQNKEFELCTAQKVQNCCSACWVLEIVCCGKSIILSKYI